MPSRNAIDEAKKGSAEVVILSIVDEEAHHGYEIAKLIEVRTGGSLTFTLASLYATLYRLEERGWIKGRWVEKAGQRRRCYYRITDAGRKVLAGQREDWSRFVAALGQVAGVKYAWESAVRLESAGPSSRPSDRRRTRAAHD